MIRVRDLSMRLASGGRPIRILDAIHLEVEAGEFVAITGPSGSGKSTLLGLIAGLDQPTTGSIEVDGVEITRLSENVLAGFRCQRIGYVFQSFHLIPTLSARENVAVPLELAGHADALARAAALLSEVGLTATRPSLPGAALRGRAAARGSRARGGASTEAAPRRRAHRKPRFRHRRRHHRADAAAQAGAGKHSAARHP